MKEKGEQYVSSTQISKEINIDASQIAKDLSYVNISGRTRVGLSLIHILAVMGIYSSLSDFNHYGWYEMASPASDDTY